MSELGCKHLTENDFNDFVKKLDFAFSQDPIEQVQQAIKFRLETLGIETTLMEKLLNTVVNWSIEGNEVTKDIVLIELGIANRFEDKLSHYFKVVDEEHYVPNTDLLEKLEVAINELSGGYIFIEGLPGIGKSTALSKFKDSHSEVTLAYYCFIPNARFDFGQLRHQSYYFLKSLCISIEKHFPEVNLPNRYSEKYAEKLTGYIEKLASLQQKILFIIDGLDHVHRDLMVGDKSLLNEIKGELPQNIFFVLSAQYKAVLSPGVLSQIKQDVRRHIVVAKFDQHQIFKYLENKGISAPQLIDEIERLSGGIPLYLHYISEQLMSQPVTRQEEILKSFPQLINNEINSYHTYLFQTIADDMFAQWVLAILAYRKESSSIETIAEILKLAGETASIIEVTKVVAAFSHLLRQTNGRGYVIFHNSFREFILNNTNDLKDRFNNALVAYYEQSPFTDEAYRNYFKHLWELEQYKKILSTTTLSWMKNAWQNFRSMEEIKENIEIALDAAIEEGSLSEFIRITYLKTQFSKTSWNLENSDIDFSLLLLNAGETGNSIRTIWDGDFISCSKEYFCFYLGKYYAKTQTLLPLNVIEQGFQKKIQDRNQKNITAALKAEALVYGNLTKLFEEIQQISWVQKSGPANKPYTKKAVSDGETAQINAEIINEILDHLVMVNKFDVIFEVFNAGVADRSIFLKVQEAMVRLLLKTDKPTALAILSEMDFADYDDTQYFKLIADLSDNLDNSEIERYFPKRKVQIPTVHNKIIENDYPGYGIREDIIDLYKKLKPIWIFDPVIVNQLAIKVPALHSPARNIYTCIIQLAEIWNKSRIINLTDSARLDLLKTAIKELYVNKPKDSLKVHRGLFDIDTDETFIRQDIHLIYAIAFELAHKLLTPEQIKELITFWLELEKSDSGYRHYNIPLAIAKVFYKSSSYVNLTFDVYQIIKHAEEIARDEHETVELTNQLGEIAQVYGMFEFSDDFKRIYNQLIDVSFGVAHRKDYQALNIIEPLTQLNDEDPENALNRIADAFNIQDKISAAGNSRMRHIGISSLVKYVITIYPELAFQLLVMDEERIGWSEAISIIFDPLIKTCQKEQLWPILTLLKSLPRWSKSSSDENYFTELAIGLLKRAIELDEKSVIQSLSKEVRQNLQVELQTPDELEKFSGVCEEAGIDPGLYSFPPVVPKAASVSAKKPEDKNKFQVKFTKPSIVELTRQFNVSFEDFYQYFVSCYHNRLINRRNQTLRNEYQRLKGLLENFLAGTISTGNGNSTISIQIIRSFIDWKNDIVKLPLDKRIAKKDILHQSIRLSQKIDQIIGNNDFSEFVRVNIDTNELLDGLVRSLEEHLEFLTSQIINENDLVYLVENASILKAELLINFLKEWTYRNNRARALIIIAGRLATLNPLQAKQLLEEAIETSNESIIFPYENNDDKSVQKIINGLFETDVNFAKRFLLKSYRNEKGRYHDLTDSLNKLLTYKNHFEEPRVLQSYYTANLIYNEALAAGLPDKRKRFDFITKHVEKLTFNESLIKYICHLFNFPVTKIRQATMKACIELFECKPYFLTTFIEFGIIEGTDNQIEHSLTCLTALAVVQPALVMPLKQHLLVLLNRDHFNILELVRELFLYLNTLENDFLSIQELETVKKVNKANKILLPPLPILFHASGQFLYSEYQRGIVRDIHDLVTNDLTYDRIYSTIVQRGFGQYSYEQDIEVHRNYNINTNFDTIEIQTPYVDEVKSAINSTLTSLIKEGVITDDDVRLIKPKLRQYDHLRLLIPIESKPSYVNWITEGITSDDFNDFEDIQKLLENFVCREENFITLAEYGNQRKSFGHDKLHATTNFEITAFLKQGNYEVSEEDLFDLIEGRYPFLETENMFMTELPSEISPSLILSKIFPILEISSNNFRAEKDLVNPNLLKRTYQSLNIKPTSLYDIINGKTRPDLEAIRWQSAYTGSTDRRRYKPTGEGTLLKIRKQKLIEFLTLNDLELWYYVSLSRSSTMYRPEDYMNWEYEQRCFNAMPLLFNT